MNAETDHTITTRDYFAASALTALATPQHADSASSPDEIAQLAYEYADAMLIERNKPCG